MAADGALDAAQEQSLKKQSLTKIDLASGSPHEAGLAPVSFVRQVLAVSLYPDLLQDHGFPLDVRQRAQQLLSTCPGGSVGVYSPSVVGIPHVLGRIAEFITRRDGGVKADPDSILFNSGTQTNLRHVLHLLASERDGAQTGVLTPVPYPDTLPGLLRLHGLGLVPYRLRPDGAVDLEGLRRAVADARARCCPRALFICNPGIPTGHVQDRETIEQVIGLAAAEGLLLLVQEVNQDCVRGPGVEFLSYRKVLLEMDHKHSRHVELISFNSLSNGSFGECGLRGGYMELVNADQEVFERLGVLFGMSSPPVITQFALEAMVNPPLPGEPSYANYLKEISEIRTSLSQNAQRGHEVLNSLKGVSCQPAMGGIFLYPRMDLPSRMKEEAKMLGLPADVLYCQMLLEKTGVVVGAGCEHGSGGAPYHYIRLSFAAAPSTFQDALLRLRSFHCRLHETYT